MGLLDRIDATPEARRWPLVRDLMRSDPLPLYAELRAHRPVLVLPEVVLATRHADCVDILSRHDVFSVAPYKPKMGDYWMAQDDTARHWREKSIMRAILDMETVPAIRDFAEAETARRLAAAGGSIDLVADVTRGVPLAIVQTFFGLSGGDVADLCRWSYWNQIDAFWNQPFDDPQIATAAQIVANREAANAEMRGFLIGLVQARAAALQAGQGGTDMVSRLFILSQSKTLQFDLPLVVLNAGGLLIGTVETTSHAVVNVLRVLAADPARHAGAVAAAQDPDPAAINGWVYEALRFRPAFPYFFRVAEQDAVLARGTDHETRVPKGAMVLAVTHSAMFDPSAQEAPERFDPTRGLGATFTFGHGLHECLGRVVGAAVIPAIVRAILRTGGAQAGDIDYRNGPVPEAWPWTIHPPAGRPD